MKHDNTEPAIAVAERAVALEPTNADFHFRLANVYTSLGRQAEAIRAWQYGSSPMSPIGTYDWP